MNLLAEHHLKYAKEWHVLWATGFKHVDTKYCEQKMWENLLLWAMHKAE